MAKFASAKFEKSNQIFLKISKILQTLYLKFLTNIKNVNFDLSINNKQYTQKFCFFFRYQTLLSKTSKSI